MPIPPSSPTKDLYFATFSETSRMYYQSIQ